jgi:hypothetical protein
MRLRRTDYVLACSVAIPTSAAPQMPAVPQGWPAQFEIGVADSPGGAAALRATAPFSSDVNTSPAA